MNLSSLTMHCLRTRRIGRSEKNCNKRNICSKDRYQEHNNEPQLRIRRQRHHVDGASAMNNEQCAMERILCDAFDTMLYATGF